MRLPPFRPLPSRRLLLPLLGALATACSAGGGREYDNNDLQLITAYTAKEMCSCLFVMEQDEAYCRTWTRQSPAIYTLRIDTGAKVVESSAGMLWGARARFESARVGCRLE
jgi:hypothetical protein